MTLIATMDIEGYPILVGDLLLSTARLHEAYKPFNIPTLSNVNRFLPENEEYIIAGLAQKITILDSRLAVGWSGDEDAAKIVIEEIISAMDVPDFDIPNLEEVFKKFDPERNNICLTGFMKSGDKVAGFGWGTESLATKEFGNMELGGSGTYDFYRAANSLQPEKMRGEANKLERAIVQTLSLTSSIMGKEILTAGSLRDFYGGGFELASSVGDKIQKIGDITYLFFQCIQSEGRKLKVLPIAIKFGYISDVLIIRKSEFTITSDFTSETNSIKNETYILSPLYRNVTDEEIEDIISQLQLPIESKFMCYYIFWPEMPINKRITTLVQYARKGEPWIRFVEDDKYTRIMITKEFISKVFS